MSGTVHVKEVALSQGLGQLMSMTSKRIHTQVTGCIPAYT